MRYAQLNPKDLVINVLERDPVRAALLKLDGIRLVAIPDGIASPPSGHRAILRGEELVRFEPWTEWLDAHRAARRGE